mgnify:FL=1
MQAGCWCPPAIRTSAERSTTQTRRAGKSNLWAASGSLRRQSPQDVKLGGRYYPDPFTHSPFEQDIATRLNAAAVLTELAFWHDLDPRAGSHIRFAVTARPSRIEPYYRLSAYQYDKDGREPLSDRELYYIVANCKGRLFDAGRRLHELPQLPL